MTEEEWLKCQAPALMLNHLFTRFPNAHRQFLLASCGCYRTCVGSIPARERALLDAAEGYADGSVTGFEYSNLSTEVTGDDRPCSEESLWLADPVCLCDTFLRGPKPKEHPDVAGVLRCVFGNPFRPVTFNPSWRTSDVMLLAQGIYDHRAFDRMPILADALQDAGCDSDDILGHCRDTSLTHVRGCWVVDLVLGKQ